MKGEHTVEEKAREQRKLKSLEQRYHHDLLSIEERQEVWAELQAKRKELAKSG